MLNLHNYLLRRYYVIQMCSENILQVHLIVHAYIYCTCTSCYILESFISLNCVNNHSIQCWSIKISRVKFNDVYLVIMDIACQFYLSSSSLIIYQFSLQVKIVCSDIQSLHYAISTVFQLFSVYKAEEIHIPPLLVSISIQLSKSSDYSVSFYDINPYCFVCR